ncbi:hypothetical protein AB0K48_13540 [Nonomuraea sp. NPDC055795]
MPVDRLQNGEWDYDLYLPDRRLFARAESGKYYLATLGIEHIGCSPYTRNAWQKWRIEEFAEDLFPTWIIYRRPSAMESDIRLPIIDHADPAAFVPYVEAVAERAVSAFQALPWSVTPGCLGAGRAGRLSGPPGRRLAAQRRHRARRGQRHGPDEGGDPVRGDTSAR